MKNIIILLIFSLFSVSNSLAQTEPISVYQKDFDDFLRTIEENFAYFKERKTDWKKVKEIYQPRVEKIKDLSNFIRLIEEIWNELYNGHMSINFNLPSSSRLIPGGADFWVEYQDGDFVVVDVREDFNADEVGIKSGMKITHFNGQPIILALEKYLPKSFSDYDAKVYSHAANVLLAGTHNQERKITAFWEGTSKDYFPDLETNKTETHSESSLLEQKKLEGNIGYIKVNNSLGNPELIPAFDKALAELMNTEALILDLRNTYNGGNTLVARGIMGRFISEDKPYQKHVFPYEEREYGIRRSTLELVSPRGETYTKPVAVLVGHWTASMGEGIAIAMDGMKRAKIVGTRMAGLLGGIDCFDLETTSIRFCFPTEQLYHLDGTPREDFVPKYFLKNSQDALDEALKLLR